MNKTICFVSAQYLPHMGGVERYTYNIAKECVERGYHVIVITSHVSGLSRHETQEGIEIIRLPSLNLMNGRLPVLKPLDREAKDTLNSIKGKIDFCVVNTRFYFLSLFGMRFAKKNNIPLITIEHGTAYLTFNNMFLNCIERIYENTVTKIGKRYCDHYYGVSQACLEWLKNFNIRGEGTLYNSIDPRDCENIKSTFKKEYKIPQNSIVVTFTGRLVKEKGIIQVVEAFNLVKDNFPNIYLVVVGDGPLSTLFDSNQDRIIYLGRKGNKEVLNVLNDSDIFCLPSESEGFSTSILEAVACKNFIITTARGGSKELLIDDEYGIIMQDNEVKKIADALTKAISEIDYRNRGIELAYQRLINNFTWEKNVDALETIMNSIN